MSSFADKEKEIEGQDKEEKEVIWVMSLRIKCRS